MPDQPALSLRLAGTFSARQSAGIEIAGLSRRAQGLLAYLACQPGMRAERGLMADLLWSDRSEDQARASLRQELAVLRKALPEGTLGANRQHVWLDAPRIAVERDSGGFLLGFDLNSEGFEDWLRDQRSRADAAPAAPSQHPAAGRSQPTLAVLPFAQLDASDGDMFADGVVEEITGALSRVHEFHVIARQSSFTLPHRLPVPEAAARLGADYIVEGSVRRAGDRVRIAVQLVNGPDGRTLWSERFDDRLDDLFDLQDRIAAQVAGQIAPNLRAAEIARARTRPPEDRSAYELYLTALPHFWISSKDGILTAIDLLDAALARDPDLAPALAYKSWATAHLATYMWSAAPDHDHDLAFDLANRAAAVAGDHAPSLVAIAATYAFSAPDPALGLDFVRRALVLDPNNAWGWMRLGWALIYDQDYAGAFDAIDRAERLSPLDPFRFNMILARAVATRESGDAEGAIGLIHSALRLRPDLTWPRRTLIGTLLTAGHDEEARREMKRLLAEHPDITPERFQKSTPRAMWSGGRDYLERFRRIGLSDG